MNIFSIYFILIQFRVFIQNCTNCLFELQMLFSQIDATQTSYFSGFVDSEVNTLQSCVIYHFKGDFVQVRDILITPIIKYATYDSFCQVGSHIDIYEW